MHPRFTLRNADVGRCNIFDRTNCSEDQYTGHHEFFETLAVDCGRSELAIEHSLLGRRRRPIADNGSDVEILCGVVLDVAIPIGFVETKLILTSGKGLILVSPLVRILLRARVDGELNNG